MTCPYPLMIVKSRETKGTVVSLEAKKQVHQFNPDDKIYVRRVVGGGKELTWRVPEDTLPEWVNIIKSHRQGVGNGSFRIQARVELVPPGEYDATVFVTGNALNSPVPIHVHLSVEE